MKLLSYAEISELGRAAEKGDKDAIVTLQSYCIDLTASVKGLKDAIKSVKDTSDRIESPN